MLLLAADFYYLKNIAGRRLVGLRWWNEVETTTGDSHWVFESQDRSGQDGGVVQNATDKRCVWLVLGGEWENNRSWLWTNAFGKSLRDDEWCLLWEDEIKNNIRIQWADLWLCKVFLAGALRSTRTMGCIGFDCDSEVGVQMVEFSG